MDARPELSRLNATELEVLILLAQGHTAKSIAAETGRSEGSVHEWLREARRKTGVGSSRELARLVYARKSRDEQIGVAGAVPAGRTEGTASLLARRKSKVLFTMVLPVTLAAALLVHVAGQQATHQPSMNGVSSGSDTEEWDVAVRHAFSGEKRDPAWAEGAEAALRDRYKAIHGVDEAALVVTCHATLCEVSGHSAPAIGPAVGKRAVEELSHSPLRRSVRGLHADVTHTGSNGEGRAYRFDFDAIWQRTPV